MTYHLNLEETELLYDIGSNVGVELRQYSGRGMYGAQCLGIVHATTDGLIQFAVLTTTEMPDEAEDILRGARQDNIGLQTITYWERLTADEDAYDYLNEIEEESESWE